MITTLEGRKELEVVAHIAAERVYEICIASKAWRDMNVDTKVGGKLHRESDRVVHAFAKNYILYRMGEADEVLDKSPTPDHDMANKIAIIVNDTIEKICLDLHEKDILADAHRRRNRSQNTTRTNNRSPWGIGA